MSLESRGNLSPQDNTFNIAITIQSTRHPKTLIELNDLKILKQWYDKEYRFYLKALQKNDIKLVYMFEDHGVYGRFHLHGLIKVPKTFKLSLLKRQGYMINYQELFNPEGWFKYASNNTNNPLFRHDELNSNNGLKGSMFKYSPDGESIYIHNYGYLFPPKAEDKNVCVGSSGDLIQNGSELNGTGAP